MHGATMKISQYNVTYATGVYLKLFKIGPKILIVNIWHLPSGHSIEREVPWLFFEA